jgi:hypothetical protein
VNVHVQETTKLHTTSTLRFEVECEGERGKEGATCSCPKMIASAPSFFDRKGNTGCGAKISAKILHAKQGLLQITNQEVLLSTSHHGEKCCFAAAAVFMLMPWTVTSFQDILVSRGTEIVYTVKHACSCTHTFIPYIHLSFALSKQICMLVRHLRDPIAHCVEHYVEMYK